MENKKGLKHFKLMQEGLCNKNLASDGLSIHVNNKGHFILVDAFSFSSSISTEKSQKIFLLPRKISF